MEDETGRISCYSLTTTQRRKKPAHVPCSRQRKECLSKRKRRRPYVIPLTPYLSWQAMVCHLQLTKTPQRSRSPGEPWLSIGILLLLLHRRRRL